MIVPGIDHVVGQGTDQDLVVGQWIDLVANDQRRRLVIAREIDPVIGLRRETDLGTDRIDLATGATGMAGMVEAPLRNAAEVQAQLILAKSVPERLLMAQLKKKAMAKTVTRQMGVRNREIRSLEGGAVEAAAVEEAAEREEKRVVMPAAEAALLALLTARENKRIEVI